MDLDGKELDTLRRALHEECWQPLIHSTDGEVLRLLSLRGWVKLKANQARYVVKVTEEGATLHYDLGGR